MEGETYQTLYNNVLGSKLTSMMDKLNAINSHTTSMEGSISTMGERLDNVKGHCYSNLSSPHNYHAS